MLNIFDEKYGRYLRRRIWPVKTVWPNTATKIILGEQQKPEVFWLKKFNAGFFENNKLEQKKRMWD